MSNTLQFLAPSANLLSSNGGEPVRFSLTNQLDERIALHWIDSDGVSKLYATLDPGQTHEQNTTAHYAWEIRSASGKADAKFLSSYTGAITLSASGQPSFADYSEQVFTTTRGLWSTSQGFGLIDVAASLGVPDSVDLPIGGQNNHLALNAINAPSAWAAGFTGKGVKVAVIDVGIADHPELAGKIVAGHDFYSNDPVATPNPGRYQHHGLGVAAIIAASHAEHGGRDTKGIAPDATLINIRVGSSEGGVTNERIAAGLRYAVEQGAKVISMSLGSDNQRTDARINEAIHDAFQKNVTVVIGGGNSSNYGPLGPALIARQFKGEVIDVGSFNLAAGTVYESSNMPGAEFFPWVTASPSGWLPNADGGYNFHADGGTSYATPYVAGLAALLWQQNPNATATQITNKILAGAHLGDSAATARVPQLSGSAANDTLTAVSGALIDGGAGIDTLRVNGAKADYAVSATDEGFALRNKADNTVMLLTDVERLAFSDAAVALDIGADGHAGEVLRLYQAAFNRLPLKGGLGFWIKAMDDGMPLSQVARNFTQSAEFKQLYGTEPAPAELVTKLFMNVLHRAPKQAGLDFWVNALESGAAPQDVLVGLSESAENQANVAELIGVGIDYTPYLG